MADRLSEAGDLFKDLFNEEFQKQNSKILKQMFSAFAIT
jgi:hypothetical protein